MSRRFLALAALLWGVIGLGQFSVAQVVTGTTNGVPIISGNTVLLGNGPTTPVLTYAAPAPTAGISNAGRAGISNSAPLPTTLPSNDTVVYYSQPGVQPMVVLPGAVQGSGPAATMPANQSAETAPEENAAPESSAPETAGKAYFDVGPSSGGEIASGGKSVSLGEVAAQYKTAKAGMNARTLTNQDVEQLLSSKASVTVAKNMPPLGPSAMPSGLTQGGAPTANQPQSTPPSETTMQGTTPGATSTTGQQTGTPPPASSAQTQPGGANAAAGASTTPKINSNQQSNDAQGKSKLPATATFLPLLGLLGVVSGGIGLLVRRLRR